MRLIFALLILISANCFAQTGVVYHADFDENVTSGVSQTLLGPQNNYLFFGQHTWICQTVPNTSTPVLVQYGGNPNNAFVNSKCPGYEGVIGVENAIVSSNNGTDTFNDATFFYVSAFATTAPVALFVTATTTASGFTNCTASGDILNGPINFEVSGGVPLGPQIRLTQPVGSVAVHCSSPMLQANTSVGKNSLGATLFTGASIVSSLINQPATMTISNVRPAQVIYSPRLPGNLDANTFDLVQGKSASFEVTLTGRNLAGMDGNVAIEIRDSSGNLLGTSASIPIASIKGQIDINGNYLLPAIAMQSMIFNDAGAVPINVHINPLLSNVLTMDKQVTLKVHKVIPPKIGMRQRHNF